MGTSAPGDRGNLCTALPSGERGDLLAEPGDRGNRFPRWRRTLSHRETVGTFLHLSHRATVGTFLRLFASGDRGNLSARSTVGTIDIGPRSPDRETVVTFLHGRPWEPSTPVLILINYY